MRLFKKISLEQRFNRLILLTIILTSCISIGLIHQFISGLYTNYTNKHWQDYTQTFAVAAVSSVVMASETQSKMIVNSFSTANNILSANIYPNSRSLISSSNQIVSCQKASLLLETLKPIDMPDFWCFYAPLLDDNKSYGAVDAKVTSYSRVMNQFGPGESYASAECGPTHDDLKPFTWSTSAFNDQIHVGQPDTFDFGFVEMDFYKH